MLLETIRQNLVQIIEEKNKDDFLSQREIAKRMKCSEGMVTALLKPTSEPKANRRRLNDQWIERFCSALGITPADLIKRAFENLVAFTSVPIQKNGVTLDIKIESPEEHDLVLKLLEMLREDPGGTGQAVKKNVVEFSHLVEMRKKAGLIPAKKEKESLPKTGTR